MIISFLKTTNIVSLFDGELSIHGLKYLAQLGADKTLYDWKRILFHYSAELYDRSEIEPIHSFLKAVSGKQFINCPFASFWCTRSSENRVVEVQDQETSPSPAASMEREAFLNHVERKLREELNQMQPNEINLIVLRASNWAIVGYEKGKPEAVFFFPEFHKRIEQFMTKERNRDLTAVVVYENNFANAQIILNSSASSRSKTDYEFVERIAR